MSNNRPQSLRIDSNEEGNEIPLMSPVWTIQSNKTPAFQQPDLNSSVKAMPLKEWDIRIETKTKVHCRT
jgi:hypothetical protein